MAPSTARDTAPPNDLSARTRHARGTRRSATAAPRGTVGAVGGDAAMPWARPRTTRDTTTTLWDRIWMALCVASLAWYLVHSEAVSAFLDEVQRLSGKL
ncbi:MAG: hypothetical protein ACE5E6_06985 [Phycisphaerae bacterium]